jgi:hypothetical protein
VGDPERAGASPGGEEDYAAEGRRMASGALCGNLSVRAIWSAVLEQAFKDLIGGDKLQARRVERWIDPAGGGGTFLIACSAVDLEPETVRARMTTAASRYRGAGTASPIGFATARRATPIPVEGCAEAIPAPEAHDTAPRAGMPAPVGAGSAAEDLPPFDPARLLRLAATTEELWDGRDLAMQLRLAGLRPPDLASPLLFLRPGPPPLAQPVSP